jgi:multiple sugar transport system permease protein
MGVMSKTAKRLINAVIIAVVAVINLTPIVWSLLTSFKSERDIYAYPMKIFNFKPTLANYVYVYGNRFGEALINSVWYALAAITICVGLAAMASYAFSRYKNKWMSALFTLVVFGIPLSIGSNALIVPNYIVFAKIGLVNKAFTLPLVYIAYNLPMSIWIAIGGMRAIPIEIEEAAILDGCSKRYIIFNLILRLNRPALACAALFVFIGSWNEFIVSAVLINSPEFRAIQVAVYDFLGYFGYQWGPLMASTVLALIPILILFSFLGRQLISGLTAGATKA